MNDLRNCNAEIVTMRGLEVRLDVHKVIKCMLFRCVKKPSSDGASEAEVNRLHLQQVTENCASWAEYRLVVGRVSFS